MNGTLRVLTAYLSTSKRLAIKPALLTPLRDSCLVSGWTTSLAVYRVWEPVGSAWSKGLICLGPASMDE